MIKRYVICLILVFVFSSSFQPVTIYAQNDNDLNSVTDCLMRYKEGYEKNDYELIAGCLYPPINEMILSQGDLVKSKKSYWI
jgi:hypothetical protein